MNHGHLSRVWSQSQVSRNPSPPPPPPPGSLSKPVAICLRRRCPAFSPVTLLGPPQSVERLAPRHALPRAPGVLLPSLHYVALSRCFRPISRVATRTSFYLQLKAFVPQRHVASHTAGARELPAGQTSDVNGHAPLQQATQCPACSSCPTGIC